MSLASGTRLGPYEIAVPIGAGGMGEVYRARDTRLGRDVALKVLPDAVAGDPDRLQRFEREAQVLASLNHPNIATIHEVAAGGAGATGGGRPVRAIVLELIEGPTLAERIAEGPLPLDEALPVARQIAAALEAAHDHGVVHRDLKPANVKLRPDGTVKVLDFGLAKAMEGDASRPGGSDASPSTPTLMSPAMTRAGTILGTAAYMAPEQAKGRDVDRRADIWAFGVVLYEMLTGRLPFPGDDVAEMLAAILRSEPDLTPVPPRARRLLARCLAKDPRQRLRDIADAWALLDDAAAPAEPAPGSGRRARLAWTVAAVAVAAAAVVSVVHFTERPDRPGTTRFHLAWPAAAPGQASGAGAFQLSPDGRHLAIVAHGALWVRALDALEPVRLDRTDGATYPFWSPDGGWIGFFAGGQLKKIAPTGGPVTVLCDATDGRGAAWSPAGAIVFSAGLGNRGLSGVADVGGTPEPVTSIEQAGRASDAHRYPQFLPGGRRFLYLHLSGDPAVAGVYVGSLDRTAPVRVLDGSDSALYVPAAAPAGGFLLYRRGDRLLAQRFDPERLAVEGAAVPVADPVDMAHNTGFGAFSASRDGTLVYGTSIGRLTELVSVDRSGRRVATIAGPDAIVQFAAAPGGRRLALTLRGSGTTGDIWLRPLEGGPAAKFTFGPAPGWGSPVWSPDGTAIAYATFFKAGLARYEIRTRPSNMAGGDESLLAAADILWVWDWSPDGRHLVYSTNEDLYLLPLAAPRTPVPLTGSPEDETAAQWSPDGRWLAYESIGGGRSDLYVQPMPPTGARWLVARDAGVPRWRADAGELYFRAADGRLMAVPVTGGRGAAVFEYGSPVALFGSVPAFGGLVVSYQPSADGSRFLVNYPAPGAEPPLTVVLHWQASLGR